MLNKPLSESESESDGSDYQLAFNSTIPCSSLIHRTRIKQQYSKCSKHREKSWYFGNEIHCQPQWNMGLLPSSL